MRNKNNTTIVGVENEKKSGRKRLYLIADFFLLLFLIAGDQLTKYMAMVSLENKGSIVLVDNVLQLTFLRNSGVILGFLPNQPAFVLFVVIILVLLMGYFLVKLPDKPKFGAIHIVLSCLLAGALGNLIDRICYGYVRDFIYLICIDFPIFNCADILISVSTIILIGLLIFYYKEQDLEFLNFKQKRYRELK